MQRLSIHRALLSVSDKTGLVDLAHELAQIGVEMISTGGTRQTLSEAGLTVRDVAEVTGFPEMLDGRVKTLHPCIHGGLLARRDDPTHQATLREHGIAPIDLVVVNLYPFERVSADPTADHDHIVENIDIGGPSMLRSAAKNAASVAVVCDPSQYPEVVAELRQHGGLCLETRERLAAAAFRRTAAYDAAVAAYLTRRSGEPFPPTLTLALNRHSMLRYGENPHQQAAFYLEPGVGHPCASHARVLHGKELSYNNWLDLDSAVNLVREFDEPAVAVLKHNNPCGAAVAETLTEAFQRAYEGDPASAFGGIIGFNREVDPDTAAQLVAPGRFVECLIAPSFHADALRQLTTQPKWKTSVRLLATGPLTPLPTSLLDYRRIDGGLLVQSRDQHPADPARWQAVTRRSASATELADLLFAWRVVKHVKSNAIVLARGRQIVGVGAGQMSRVDAVRIAVHKAGERARGAVLASDAFFPFRDNIDTAAAAGVTAVVQPGGSVRDAESIAACDDHGLAMLMTGIRHFKH